MNPRGGEDLRAGTVATRAERAVERWAARLGLAELSPPHAARIVVTLWLAALGVAASAVNGLAAAWVGSWTWAALCLLTGVALLLAAASGLHARHAPRAGWALLLAAGVLVVLLTLATGGLDGPIATYLVLLPPVGVVLLGTDGLVMGAVGTGAWLVVLTAVELLIGAPLDVADDAMAPVYHLVTDLVCVAVVTSAVLYLVATGARARADIERAHGRLARASEDALRASAAKSAFLARMSHELRTPLHTVIGVTALADDGLGAGDVAMVRAASAQLLAKIEAILEFTAVDEQGFVVQVNDVHVGELLGEVARAEAPRAAELGLALRVAIDADCVIRGDARRLRQVLGILLDNAFTFTDEGSVTLGCRLDEGVALRVEDTGPGVPPALRERIFEPFEQADGSFTRAHEGTGLGLALARRLARAMGATISVAPGEGGVGSRFEVRFGADVVVRPGPPASAVRARSRVVLVVDDNHTSRVVAERMLLRLGHHVLGASSGLEALAVVDRHPEIDLVLMDVRMPGLDGVETARRLRARPETRGLEVVALTADAGEETARRCAEVGMREVLTKPATLERLGAVLEALDAARGGP